MKILTKSEFRRGVRSKILTINSYDYMVYSKMVFMQVDSLIRECGAMVIGLYSALPDELPTHEFIDKLLVDREVCLPVVDGDSMSFYRYDPKEEMSIGAYGIAEPKRGALVVPDEIELMVVPGVAFDCCGNRLGRGKGYYDRYLAECNAIRVGVCSDTQLFDQLPHDELDCPMNYIVTPRGLIVI